MPDRPPEPRRTSAAGATRRRPSDAEGPAAGRRPDAAGSIEGGSSRALERQISGRDRRIRALEARVAERDRLAGELRGRITERGLYATWLESEVGQREERIGELAGQIAERSAERDRAEATLEAIRGSRTWKVVRALGRAVDRVRGLKRTAGLLPGRVIRGGFWPRPRPSTAPDAKDAHADRLPRLGPEAGDGGIGTSSAPPGIPDRDPNAILRFIPPRGDAYDAWLRNNAWDPSSVVEAERTLAGLGRRPTFSVIVSGIGVEPWLVRETLASLREQVDPDREVILVGGSGSLAASLSGRVVLADGDGEGGRLEALSSAAERATSEYLVILDGGARLAPDALLEWARAAAEGGEPPDLVFADEDRVDPDGRRFAPRFRPGWSPESLLAQHSIGRTFAVRRLAFEQVGGLRSEFGDAWPYDLALRLAERPGRIARVPRVLVHVPADRDGDDPIDRRSSRSIALAGRALAGALERRGIEARVGQPAWAARERYPAFELDFPDRGPRVAILIPTRDRVDLLRRCIESILDRTTYRDFEVVVIDNGSTDPATLAYLDRLDEPCRVVRIEGEDGRFNYARLHNQAIGMLGDDVEFVVLLNNDTEVRRGEWLGQLVGYGRMPGVGTVGARLLYADGRVQHAGILTDLYHGEPGHAFRLAPWWDRDGQRLDRLARNVGAVTAACLLIRRDTFRDLGGFDEERFAVGYNDVDFCLRLADRGLRSVYAPRAELLHFEGASRGFESSPEEAGAFRTAWGGHVDPYHHPSLARCDERLGPCTRRYGPLGEAGDRVLRLLIDVDRLDGSGNARFVRGLAEGLRDRGRIVPEVRARLDGPTGDRLRDAGIPVAIDSGSDGMTVIDRAQAMADLSARGGHDLIHVVGLDGFASVHAARLAGVPALWTVREAVDFRDAFGHLEDEAARVAIEAFSDAYRVIFPSWGVRRPYHPVESRWNFEVVYEHLPTADAAPDRAHGRRRLGLPDSTAVVTCLADEGGAIDFLDAASGLIRSGRDVVAVLVAPAEAIREHERIEAVRSLPDRIRFLPSTKDPGPVLAASDVLVSCPRRDLDPAAIAIGRGFHLPMVLTEVPGVDEYARPGRTALLSEAGDAAMLADRIARLLDDPGRRASLVAAALADGGRLGSFRAMVDAYDRLDREAVVVGMARGPIGPGIRLGAA